MNIVTYRMIVIHNLFYVHLPEFTLPLMELNPQTEKLEPPNIPSTLDCGQTAVSSSAVNRSLLSSLPQAHAAKK